MTNIKRVGKWYGRFLSPRKQSYFTFDGQICPLIPYLGSCGFGVPKRSLRPAKQPNFTDIGVVVLYILHARDEQRRVYKIVGNMNKV